jgi:hypothetical protein
MIDAQLLVECREMPWYPELNYRCSRGDWVVPAIRTPDHPRATMGPRAIMSFTFAERTPETTTLGALTELHYVICIEFIAYIRTYSPTFRPIIHDNFPDWMRDLLVSFAINFSRGNQSIFKSVNGFWERSCNKMVWFSEGWCLSKD